MTPPFAPKYDPDQAAAVLDAYSRPGNTAGEVCRLAALGELRAPDGRRLDRFTLVESSVRSMATRARARLHSEAVGSIEAGDATPREVAFTLAQELMAITRSYVARLKADEKNGLTTGEQIRQATNALLTLAKLPDPAAARPPETTALGASILDDAGAAPGIERPDPAEWTAPDRYGQEPAEEHELVEPPVWAAPPRDRHEPVDDLPEPTPDEPQFVRKLRRNLEELCAREERERQPEPTPPAYRTETRTAMSGPLGDAWPEPGPEPPIVVPDDREQPRRRRRTRRVA